MIKHLDNHIHAFVKNGIVFNLAAFAGHDSELLEQFRKHYNADEIVSCCDNGMGFINGTWDGKEFIPPAPFASWIWNSTLKIYEPPIEYPLDGNNYIWNENSKSWILN